MLSGTSTSRITGAVGRWNPCCVSGTRIRPLGASALRFPRLCAATCNSLRPLGSAISSSGSVNSASSFFALRPVFSSICFFTFFAVRSRSASSSRRSRSCSSRSLRSSSARRLSSSDRRRSSSSARRRSSSARRRASVSCSSWSRCASCSASARRAASASSRAVSLSPSVLRFT